MNPLKIFIVEDDAFFGKALQYKLNLNPDNEVELISNGKDFLNRLHEKPDMVTLDYNLPDISGTEILEQLNERLPNVPVVVISGQKDIQTVIDILKKGAYDYLIKDEETHDRIWHIVNKVRENSDLKEEISVLKKEVKKKYDFNKLIKGNSSAIQNIFSLISKACETKITVSITGETGTGKELVAKSIHYNSKLANKPFVTVNMAAIPKDLAESELFGHEKGAFTGATTRKIGLFERANEGTLFLDEIGDLDSSLQAKLLRVLQEKELNRVGGDETIKVNIRLIVATHKDLSKEVKEGKFRSDLYYRLLGLPIQIPPLRDRQKDIIIIARHLIKDFCVDNEIKEPALSSAATKKLMKYGFPGNVRELKAIVELATVMCDGKSIEPTDIQFGNNNDTIDLLLNEKSLKEYNEEIINHFLDKYNDNIKIVSEKLDIGKSTIYNLKKKQLEET